MCRDQSYARDQTAGGCIQPIPHHPAVRVHRHGAPPQACDEGEQARTKDHRRPPEGGVDVHDVMAASSPPQRAAIIDCPPEVRDRQLSIGWELVAGEVEQRHLVLLLQIRGEEDAEERGDTSTIRWPLAHQQDAAHHVLRRRGSFVASGITCSSHELSRRRHEATVAQIGQIPIYQLRTGVRLPNAR